jgi:isoleucyl-tRNA synthetase
MIAEEIWQGLTNSDDTQPPSVHLTEWPSVDAFPADHELVAAMDRVREVASTALRLREDAGLRVRLPLASVSVAGHHAEALASLVDLIADEINVKSVELTEEIGDRATFVLQPDGKVLGPRLGKDVQAVFGAARSGEWTAHDDGTVSIAGHTLSPGEYELALESPEGVTAAALRSNDAVVTLDTELTPELEAEGLARDVVREIQNARKVEDLVVTDRIELWVDIAADAVEAAMRTHEGYIAEQVLATSITYGTMPDEPDVHDAKIGGEVFRFAVRALA